MAEAHKRADRCDDHRRRLGPAEALALRIAVNDEQRVEPDRAIVDEDAPVHLRHVDASLGPLRN